MQNIRTIQTVFILLNVLFFVNPVFTQSESPLKTVLQQGHIDYIKTYDFTPDNQYLVTGSFDHVLILWELRSGKQIRTFFGHTASIRSVAISPNQNYILSVAANNTAKLFDMATGEAKYTWTLKQQIFTKGYFSNNGEYAYILDNRDRVFVWETATGKKVGTYKKSFSAHDEAALIHPTQPLILSVGDNKQTFVINMQTKDTLLKLPFDKVYSQSFSPNGKYIGVSSRKLFTQIFDAETGRLMHTLAATEQQCDGCNTKHSFNAKSEQIVTLSNKDDAVIWNVKSGKKIHHLTTLAERPTLVKYSPKGTYLLLVFDDVLFMFSAKSGVKKWTLENKYIEYLDIKFTADESTIAVPNKNGGIVLLNTSNGKRIKTIQGYLNQAQHTKMDLDYSDWGDQSILHYLQHKRKVLVSPDNKHVLIGAVDTVAMLLNIETGKIVQHFIGHNKAVYAFDFNQDGSKIATGGGDRVIIIWDVKTGKAIKRLKGHQQTIFDLKFSQDGRSLISGAWDGTLRMWDLATETYDYIQLKDYSPYSVGFSPNELYIVTADLDKNVQFWERDALAPFRTLVGHTNVPSGFDFSPSSKEMATCSWDGNVKVWDVLTGMLVNRMNDFNCPVHTVKYHPQNKYVAAGGANGEIILWNPAENKIITRLAGHSTAVTSLDFDTDGKQLISMSSDGLMNVWDLATFSLRYSRVQLQRNEWLATNPKGYFDGSSNALKWVNYVKENQVVNVSNLFNKYYTPNLIQQVSTDKAFNDRGQLRKEDMNLPQISIAFNTTEKRNLITTNDSVYTSQANLLPLTVYSEKSNTPLDEIRIYNNGKLTHIESVEENIVFRGGAKNRFTFELPLVNGVNEFKVVAVNQRQTESEPSFLTINYNGKQAKTDLYIVSIGINAYKNPSYNLDYAVNDAKSFVKSITKGTDSLFNEVFVYSLTDKNATKTQIEQTLKDITSQIGSEDVFLFYYAGHGVMNTTAENTDKKFYIVTHDVTNLYATDSTLTQKAISATDLMNYSVNIRAEKQLFVLDACHAGGAIEAFTTRGNEREKAIAQLARSTGTFFLTASQAIEYANEVGKLNHGLFTYALLEMLEGKITNADKKVTVSELKAYVEERVPELSEQYHGTPQYPTGYSFGRDFPIVLLK